MAGKALWSLDWQPSPQEVHVMLAENINRWFDEAEARGKAEGNAKGVVETFRENLLSYLEIKLGNVPDWLRQCIQASDDKTVLNRALKTAYEARDVRSSLPKLRSLLQGS